MCMWDVQSRVIKLSQLGLFPKIFGQDLTKVSLNCQILVVLLYQVYLSLLFSPTVGHSEILREVDISASIYNIANDWIENTLQPYRC